jgi:hypothetical protein
MRTKELAEVQNIITALIPKLYGIEDYLIANSATGTWYETQWNLQVKFSELGMLIGKLDSLVNRE